MPPDYRHGDIKKYVETQNFDIVLENTTVFSYSKCFIALLGYLTGIRV